MKKSKIKTNRKIAHTPKSPKGSGDFYGTGIRAKIGTLKNSFFEDQDTSKKLGKPPKSLA